MAVDLEARLAEAETAYHHLALGQTAVEFRDQNGELIRYSPASRHVLWSYILRLRSELGKPVTGRPGRAIF